MPRRPPDGGRLAKRTERSCGLDRLRCGFDFFRQFYISRDVVLEVEVSLSAGVYEPVNTDCRHDLSTGMACEVDIYVPIEPILF